MEHTFTVAFLRQANPILYKFSLMGEEFTLEQKYSLKMNNRQYEHVTTLSLSIEGEKTFPAMIRWTLGDKSNLFDRHIHFGDSRACKIEWDELGSFMKDNKVTVTIYMSDRRVGTLFNNPDASDVQVQVKDQIFHLHKCILSKASPVMKRVLETNEKFSIEDFSLDVVIYSIRYVYEEPTTQVRGNEVEYLEVCRFADKYDIRLLRVHSLEKLKSGLNKDNCFDVFRYAIENNHFQLKIHTLEYMRSYSSTKYIYRTNKRHLIEAFGEEGSLKFAEMLFNPN